MRSLILRSTPLVSLMLITVFVTSCRQPSAPSPITPAISSIRIDGPATLTPPGGGRSSAKYAAIASYSDGTTKDVTGLVTWTIERGDVSPAIPIRSTGSGEIEAWTRGEAHVVVTLAGATGRRIVFVMEDGTFSLTGRVIGFTTKPDIRVQSGVGMGVEPVIGSGGTYGFYGVAGRITVGVAGIAGYPEQSWTLDVAANMKADLRLETDAMPFDITGARLPAVGTSTVPAVVAGPFNRRD